MQASGIRKCQHIVLERRSGGSRAHCFVCFVTGGAERGVGTASACAMRYVGGRNVLIALRLAKYLSDKNTNVSSGVGGGGRGGGGGGGGKKINPKQ